MSPIPKPEILKHMQLLRRDQGNLLFHFTRRTEGKSAADVIEDILRQGCLKGSSGLIKGRYNCVCFTEAPITELAPIFSLSKLASFQQGTFRYEPFGIAVSKEWLFEQGGRPVIYQSDSEFHTLPDELKYRHVRYEPTKGLDFTWEREWRIRTDELKLDPKETLVIVPTSGKAFEFMYSHSTLEATSFDRETGFADSVAHEPMWMAVSLSFFGFHEDDGDNWW
jgi:hypothetical protein